jgi:hypothetical protein
VYDVSAGPQFYGPKGGYKFFAGRDGTRGFLTGCFEPDCLLPDLNGLPEDQIKGLESWTKTYTRKYVWVGVLHEDERRCTPEQLEKARELERKAKR